jgi:hypothetical protein
VNRLQGIWKGLWDRSLSGQALVVILLVGILYWPIQELRDSEIELPFIDTELHLTDAPLPSLKADGGQYTVVGGGNVEVKLFPRDKAQGAIKDRDKVEGHLLLADVSAGKPIPASAVGPATSAPSSGSRPVAVSVSKASLTDISIGDKVSLYVYPSLKGTDAAVVPDADPARGEFRGITVLNIISSEDKAASTSTVVLALAQADLSRFAQRLAAGEIVFVKE